MAFTGIGVGETDRLIEITPMHVGAWRDALREKGLTNASIRRKLTVLRSLFSYLKNYGYTGPNPAHSDFVEAPAVPRDGKTVGLAPEACRRLLDAPKVQTMDPMTNEAMLIPSGIRDRALLAVLAYSGCRVGELARLKVGSYKLNGAHRVLEIMGKGGKERLVPVHPEAAERLEEWLDIADLRGDLSGPLFRPALVARNRGRGGFARRSMSRRAIQKLIETYVTRLKLDPNVTVHSLRVTAITTAREQGCDILELQSYAGHSDPRTTLAYIRARDRLSKSPAYVLKY